MADLDMDGVAAEERKSGKAKRTAKDTADPADEGDTGQTPAEAGDGPGGRPQVRVASEGRIVTRAPRSGDQVRPRCPSCSTETTAVLCGARNSTGLITSYYCPSCEYSVQRLRPVVAQQLQEQSAARQSRQRPFAERED